MEIAGHGLGEGADRARPVAATIGEILRPHPPGPKLMAPHVGRDREARRIDREEVASIEVRGAMGTVVGERLERREPARIVNIVDDPEPLDVPLAPESPL